MDERAVVSRGWLLVGALIVTGEVFFGWAQHRSVGATFLRAAGFGSLYVWIAISIPPRARAYRKVLRSLPRRDRGAVIRAIRAGRAVPESRLVPAVVTLGEHYRTPIGFARARAAIEGFWCLLGVAVLITGIARGDAFLGVRSVVFFGVAVALRWVQRRRARWQESAAVAVRDSMLKYASPNG